MEVILTRALLVFCALLPVCYSGDGQYKTDGFLLKRHTLELPLGSLGEKGEYSFEIEGFALNPAAIQMRIVVESPRLEKYWEMQAVVALQIYDMGEQNVLYEKRAVLPEYYLRVKAGGGRDKKNRRLARDFYVRARDPRVKGAGVLCASRHRPRAY